MLKAIALDATQKEQQMWQVISHERTVNRLFYQPAYFRMVFSILLGAVNPEGNVELGNDILALVLKIPTHFLTIVIN